MNRLARIVRSATPSTAVKFCKRAYGKGGVEEFLRVKLGRVGDRIVATPLPRGSGNITTFTEASSRIRLAILRSTGCT